MTRGYSYGIVAALIAIGLVATLGAQPPAGGQGTRGQGMGRGMGGQGMGPGDGPMAALVLTAEQRKIVIESGMEFPSAQMGQGGMRGGRGGQEPVKK